MVQVCICLCMCIFTYLCLCVYAYMYVVYTWCILQRVETHHLRSVVYVFLWRSNETHMDNRGHFIRMSEQRFITFASCLFFYTMAPTIQLLLFFCNLLLWLSSMGHFISHLTSSKILVQISVSQVDQAWWLWKKIRGDFLKCVIWMLGILLHSHWEHIAFQLLPLNWQLGSHLFLWCSSAMFQLPPYAVLT